MLMVVKICVQCLLVKGGGGNRPGMERHKSSERAELSSQVLTFSFPCYHGLTGTN